MFDQEVALERLGYDPRWVEEGLLTVNLLERQYAEINGAGADRNTEHYRAAALEDFLAARASLTDREVEAVLGVGAIDPDEVLRANFPHSLIRFSGLTDAQFELVSGSLDDDSFRRAVNRHRWLRLLAGESVSAADLERAVRAGDAEVHRALLGRPDLSRHHVEILVEHGENRAVRNQATQLLGSRKFR